MFLTVVAFKTKKQEYKTRVLRKFTKNLDCIIFRVYMLYVPVSCFFYRVIH